MDLGGKTVLERVISRVRAAKLVDEVVVATTLDRKDLPIVAWCATNGIRVFCGSEDDVLDRFYQAARLIQPEVLLRITADCPLIDPEIIDQVVSLRHKDNLDYANNVEHETFPDGLDVEVMKWEALERAWKEATLGSEREHVTPYIRNHPEFFRLEVLDHEPSLAGMRWTLDRSEDFQFLKQVIAELGDETCTLKAVLRLLQKKPELCKINGSIVRNEGYFKSLANDSSRVKE